MTALRKSAMRELEKLPEDKISFVLQILQSVNGLLGTSDIQEKEVIDLKQFVMPTTERARKADEYIRALRDNDRF